jgi:hypothetical protein
MEIAKQRKRRRDLNSFVEQLAKQETTFLAKKYDRNCENIFIYFFFIIFFSLSGFFSPVQCTLQRWGDGNPADDVLLGGGSGRVRRR